ncbi:DUF4253 domain-containing protein [Microtetraspora sp. NBRC 16547]|uniref:DUF4253 domain-containing protein n=1 Tax=Microtetraspora sp. NBRC 16547 TaxID=3030993 RepID=UPI0024A255AF|nr:DUF4253 domain-containing protein [Microtetraspora sp. NBRC 16547]GLW99102.1 hypothetical protein Misp02_31890 [Microtetraspora sp. NBRC 16547]
MPETMLPDDLARLLPDDGVRRTLEVTPPAGRLVAPDPSMVTPGATDFERPVLWMSSQPVDGRVWSAFRDQHPRSGLWPLLLLHDLADGDDDRPWADGELTPWPVAEIDEHDAAAFVAEEWSGWTEEADGDDQVFGLKDLEPFGRECPGLAPVAAVTEDPSAVADRFAREMAGRPAHLGLVAAGRGADALTVIGWLGPINRHETPPLSAMLRSWEERFGVRVVAVGFDTLYLSVAAPPTTPEEALRVAAEHFVFCPDNIQQGDADGTLRSYAERLVGANAWAFWWD